MTTTTNYGWDKPDSSTDVRIWEWVGTFLDEIDATMKDNAPFTPKMATDAAPATTSSASYTATVSGGTSSFNTTFVATRTAHTITVSAFMLNAGSIGPYTFFMAPVVTGSGFSTYGPNDTDAAVAQFVNTSVPGSTCTRSTVVTGLTPGTTYTVTLQQKATGSTGEFANRRIVIS
jgi:hypothetical protein